MAMLTAAGLLKAKLIKKQVAVEMWVAPIQDFFIRYGKKAVWLILLIGLYRISDIVAGTTSNLFYVNLGLVKQISPWRSKRLVWACLFWVLSWAVYWQSVLKS